MKTMKLIMAFAIVLSGAVVFGQNAQVNAKDSKIKWFGEKIGGAHEGYISLKVETLK